MKWKIKFKKQPEKYLTKLNDEERTRILKAVYKLCEKWPFYHQPDLDIKRLKGSDEWRLRVGEWRIIFYPDEGQFIIVVIEIGSRGDIYKN